MDFGRIESYPCTISQFIESNKQSPLEARTKFVMFTCLLSERLEIILLVKTISTRAVNCIWVKVVESSLKQRLCARANVVVSFIAETMCLSPYAETFPFEQERRSFFEAKDGFPFWKVYPPFRQGTRLWEEWPTICSSGDPSESEFNWFSCPFKYSLGEHSLHALANEVPAS